MTDTRTRELERAAAQGDEHAEEALSRARARRGNGPHADKVGEWVVLDGVRDHYRGKLLAVSPQGYGHYHLHLAPAYWLASLESPDGERPTTGTEAHPFDLRSDVIQAVSLQPADWPRQ